MKRASREPKPWLVEWEAPALVRTYCSEHFTAEHWDRDIRCGLEDREPSDTMAGKSFLEEAEARAFADEKAGEPNVGMVSITKRLIEKDRYAPGLYDITDIACWSRTTDGKWDGGTL